MVCYKLLVGLANLLSSEEVMPELGLGKAYSLAL